MTRDSAADEAQDMLWIVCACVYGVVGVQYVCVRVFPGCVFGRGDQTGVPVRDKGCG